MPEPLDVWASYAVFLKLLTILCCSTQEGPPTARSPILLPLFSTLSSHQDISHENLKYQIDQVSPFCIFGRIYLLEGMAAEFGPHLLTQVEKSFGLQATRFLKLHTIEDQGHHESSMKLLDLMSPEQIKFVQQGLDSSVVIYSQLVNQWQQMFQLNQFRPTIQVA